MNKVTLEIETREDITLFNKLNGCFTLELPFALQGKSYRVSGKEINVGRYGTDSTFSLHEVRVPKTAKQQMEDELAAVMAKWKDVV